jgi:hypothetical protein
MSKLTDKQLVTLSSALRPNDRGVDLPAGRSSVRKAVDKLIRAGLLEEVRSYGSLLGWRRNAEAEPMRFASPALGERLLVQITMRNTRRFLQPALQLIVRRNPWSHGTSEPCPHVMGCHGMSRRQALSQ